MPHFMARFPWLRRHVNGGFTRICHCFQTVWKVSTTSVGFLRTSGIGSPRYRNYLCFAILIIAMKFIVMKRTYFVEVVIFLI